MLNSLNAEHLHLLLNHFPTVGFSIGLGLFLVALFVKSAELKQAALVIFIAMALLSLPTYLSGNAAHFAIKDHDGAKGQVDVGLWVGERILDVQVVEAEIKCSAEAWTKPRTSRCYKVKAHFRVISSRTQWEREACAYCYRDVFERILRVKRHDGEETHHNAEKGRSYPQMLHHILIG